MARTASVLVLAARTLRAAVLTTSGQSRMDGGNCGAISASSSAYLSRASATHSVGAFRRSQVSIDICVLRERLATLVSAPLLLPCVGPVEPLPAAALDDAPGPSPFASV